MTNASVKKSFAVLSLVAVFSLLSSGVFASIAHAQDDGGYMDFSGDNGGYLDFSSDNSGGYMDYSGDNGGYMDYSGDNGGYMDYSGDNGSYLDLSGDNGGYLDLSGDNGGYLDLSGDNGGYYDFAGDNGGYMDMGNTCAYGCTQEGGVSYTQEAYTTPQYSSGFSLPQSFTSGASTPSYASSGYSIPSTGSSIRSIPISVPTSYSVPQSYASYSQPITYQQPVQQQTQRQQQQQQQQPIVITTQNPQVPVIVTQNPTPVVVTPNVTTTTNTCSNGTNLCNTTYTDNSINGSFNTTTNTAPVVPVAATTVSYPIQYTFPQQYNYQQNYQNVSCTISASPNSIQQGQYSYITWQSYGAVSASLSTYGNVAPNGSLSIQPGTSQNIVLTVYGQNGQTATCNTFVTVGQNAPYVTLSQIPYTGFDFGSFGDAMYFAALALFAAAAGYLMVYYKGGMGAFALSGVMSRKHTFTPVVFTEETPVEPTPEAPVESPVVEEEPVSFNLPVLETARPTIDSMNISKEGGIPRLVISRA